MWVCTRKFVCRKNLGVKIPCLTPQVNFWGSFDPLDPTVPAPLASTHLAVGLRAVARKNDANVGHLVTYTTYTFSTRERNAYLDCLYKLLDSLSNCSFHRLSLWFIYSLVFCLLTIGSLRPG